MPDLVKYAEEVGVRYLNFTLFNLASVTDIELDYYKFYSSSELLSVLKKTDEVIAKNPNVIVTNRHFKKSNGSFQKCHFPWSNFYICWDGFIVPCCAKPFPKELNFGNVFDNKVINVLNSKDYQKFRTRWYKNEAPAFCNKCHFLDIEPVKTSR